MKFKVPQDFMRSMSGRHEKPLDVLPPHPLER